MNSKSTQSTQQVLGLCINSPSLKKNLKKKPMKMREFSCLYVCISIYIHKYLHTARSLVLAHTLESSYTLAHISKILIDEYT